MENRYFWAIICVIDPNYLGLKTARTAFHDVYTRMLGQYSVSFEPKTVFAVAPLFLVSIIRRGLTIFILILLRLLFLMDRGGGLILPTVK